MIKIKILLFVIFYIYSYSVFSADFFYWNSKDIAEYDEDTNLTIYRDSDNKSLIFFYKDTKLPMTVLNNLSPTDGSPFLTMIKKNIICTEVVMGESGVAQNTRNIYKIYNKSYVKAFTTKNPNVTCESELRKIK